MSFSTRFSQVFSTPNLRLDISGDRSRRLRRSHSATSIALPIPSPISPLRLPSLKTHDQDGLPWSEIIHESLRLSQFPVSPHHSSAKTSKTASDTAHRSNDNMHRCKSLEGVNELLANRIPNDLIIPVVQDVEIRLQQPTSITSPRASTSVRGVFRNSTISLKENEVEEARKKEESDDPRHSLHLYTMRISHHLRSGSLLSWDQLADASEPPTSSRPCPERTITDQSQRTYEHQTLVRHERRTSSSGFASSKVPSRWGRVLSNDGDLRADVASSIYSSRPQSPPDSFGGSMINLSRGGTFSLSSMDFKQPRRSNSFPTDNKDTPQITQQCSVTSFVRAQNYTEEIPQHTVSIPLARKNSVADTKTSKFREELSPLPSNKTLSSSSTSIIKFLSPKRLNIRSQSETNLKLDLPEMAMDGLTDSPSLVTVRERRQSRSLISLQADQEVPKQNTGANHVWDRAMKAHQEEKASLILPKNRDLAIHASPFRERSGSTAATRASVGCVTIPDPTAAVANNPKIPSALLLGPTSSISPQADYPRVLTLRRSALRVRDSANPGMEISDVFETQGDSPEVVGAWGRYPSHTRQDRTFSASRLDHVDTRDFALEAAVKFASAKEDTYDDDLVDPTERLPSPPPLPGRKKNKRRKVGSGRMANTNSMTFGKTFLKNYSKIFKSQSMEFRRHGRGHRSSITSGGILEFPELELLPDVWTAELTEEGHRKLNDASAVQDAQQYQDRSNGVNGEARMRGGDSLATLRPYHNSSTPNLGDISFRDGAKEVEQVQDCARGWSIYYENCVPSFPRQSTEADFVHDGTVGLPRLSLDLKRASLYSHPLPVRIPRHSRKPSQLSHVTQGSRGSARPNSIFMDDDKYGGEDMNLVSVRRSTMDLILKFKEQEDTEHQRVVALTRGEP